MSDPRAATRMVVRRTMVTAWLALLVPLGGIMLAIVVGNSDENITSADPLVTWGFFGGAAIGLALWLIGVRTLMQRGFEPGRPVPSTGLFLFAWPLAAVVFVVVNLTSGSGGAAAGLATTTALAWWWHGWSRLFDPAIGGARERFEGPPDDGPSEASG